MSEQCMYAGECLTTLIFNVSQSGGDTYRVSADHDVPSESCSSFSGANSASLESESLPTVTPNLAPRSTTSPGLAGRTRLWEYPAAGRCREGSDTYWGVDCDVFT